MTRTATRTALLLATREQVFEAVTRIEDQSWRPSVGSVRVIKPDDGREEWVEVSKVLGYLFFDLVAILDTYISDLKNKLQGEGDDQASR